MTRYEYLKNASIEEVASVLCCITDNAISNVDGACREGCEFCLATNLCKKGDNGFVNWLNKEAKFSEVTKDLIVWDD